MSQCWGLPVWSLYPLPRHLRTGHLEPTSFSELIRPAAARPAMYCPPSPSSTLATLALRSRAALIGAVAVWSAGAQTAVAPAADSGFPDLAELGRIEVVTVSKRPQPAWSAAAALSVVSSDDIRRSGAINLPEALRLALGLDVAQIDARNWAISARGFDAQYANKLLVMIDGRSVYTPLFGGVFWDQQDVMLEDVGHIEVVRGPGAALWGANAMNGVINVVSKSARDTTGGLIVAAAGTDHSGATVRWGAAPNDRWAWRVYAKADDYAQSDSETFSSGAGDAWRSGCAGFRADFTPDSDRTLTLQVNANAIAADYTQYLAGPTVPGFQTDDRSTGYSANSLDSQVRWEQRLSDGGSSLAQIWTDHTWERSAVLNELRDTLALDWQRSRPFGRHTLTWGLGYERSWDQISGGLIVHVQQSSFTTDLFSGFVQDEISILPDRFDVVAGARLEHNSFTDFEVQPSLRGVWRPSATDTIWASVSQAVRSPTRLETGLVVTPSALPAGTLGAGTPPALVEWLGSQDFRSEVVVAWEAGWRTQLSPQFTLDATLFLQDYSRLQDIVPTSQYQPEQTAQGPVIIWPWHYANTLSGQSYGTEIGATWQPSSALRLTAGYTFDRLEESGPAGGVNEAYFENSTPRNSGFLRVGITLGGGWEIDSDVRTVAAVPAVAVGGYTALNLRLAWLPSSGLQIELLGRNLTDPAHPEFRDGLATQIAEIRRGVELRVTGKF